MISVDTHGRAWDLPHTELCPICWQPDNCGECSHEPLSDDEAKRLGALTIKFNLHFNPHIT